MNVKKIFTLFVAGLATSLALVSCAKQDAIDNGSTSPAGGARTIAVSFANASVKSALGEDGLTPKFKDGDVIKVANGVDAPEDCIVSVDGDEASITTNLKGNLRAVYPATAAKMDSKNENAIADILVPTHQDGTFASANICQATIADGATEAQFENQTAVFKITPGAGATYVDVIAPHDKVLADYVPEGSVFNCDSYHKIRVPVTSGSAVYVSIQVPADLSLKALTFASNSGIKTLTSSDAVAVNSLYTVTEENWSSLHPYVEIGGKKWATMNVGATTVASCHCTSDGDYFAWGETEPYYEDISYASAGTSIIKWKTYPRTYSTGGYGWTNYKYCNGTANTLTKYNVNAYYGTVDNKTVLDPEDDAATANWGSIWHMPTLEDFKKLHEACGSVVMPKNLTSSTPNGGVYSLLANQTYLPEYQGAIGLLFVDNTDTSKRVFFPIAGNVLGTTFGNTGALSCYWSRSLSTSQQNQAYILAIGVMILNPSSPGDRYSGFSVRPVSE